MNNLFVKVGRHQAFEDAKDKTKLSPVSCTVITVEDSMESICESWTFLAMAVKGGAGVAIDLSNLRPAGTVGTGGLVSLGVANFLTVYSSIVESVRQGRSGVKKGAGLVFLNASHPDLKSFLELPREDTPCISKAIYLKDSDLENQEIVNLVLKALAQGDIFISKYVYNQRGQRLYNNLCTEVYLKSQMTCILGQINLANATDETDFTESFMLGYFELDRVRKEAKESSLAKIYKNPDEDKQIGLGVMGLASLLANRGIKYQSFVKALKFVREAHDGQEFYLNQLLSKACVDPAIDLANALHTAYRKVSNIAIAMGYERVFAIAPTASVSYRTTDSNGYTVTPEISPPVCNKETKQVRRVRSGGYDVFQFPPNIEIAGSDVSWEIYDELVSEWQMMQDCSGLAHAVSSNWWSTKPVSKENLKEFMSSPRRSIYYQYPVNIDVADKTNVQLDGIDSETLESFWGADEEEDEDEKTDICPIRTAENDPNYCAACAA